jgi:mRNA interferase RelE/StbE
MLAFALEIPPHVAEVLRHLPPDVKRSVKAALRGVAMNPAIGSPLERELKGLWRFRVRRFRIVYEVDRKRRRVRVMAVVHRRDVYDQLAPLVRKK